jgi:hypothetical protein
MLNGCISAVFYFVGGNIGVNLTRFHQWLIEPLKFNPAVYQI